MGKLWFLVIGFYSGVGLMCLLFMAKKSTKHMDSNIEGGPEAWGTNSKRN